MNKERADAPTIIKLDSCDHPVDVIDARVLRAFASGAFPWAKSVGLERVKPNAPRLPAGATSQLVATHSYKHSTYAEGEGYRIRIERYNNRVAEVLVVAVDEATGEAALQEATTDSVEAPDDDMAVINFWFRGGRCPERRERLVATTCWSDIRRNYSGSVAGALDDVVALEPSMLHGRLLLLHGPPGTGKTTALRALTNEWRSWCSVEYILDPERLFDDSEYLAHVVFDFDSAGQAPFRLLILEDCDELIRADAKRRTGQALARVLNLADGLPAQGVQLMLAITTNEPLAELHPAIVRPGRCLAQIEVGGLDAAEASAWLGRRASVGPDGATLAELFAMRGELSVVGTTVERRAAGHYL